MLEINKWVKKNELHIRKLIRRTYWFATNNIRKNPWLWYLIINVQNNKEKDVRSATILGYDSGTVIKYSNLAYSSEEDS